MKQRAVVYVVGLILAFRAYQRCEMPIGWFLTGLLGLCFLFWAYGRARKNQLHEISASADPHEAMPQQLQIQTIATAVASIVYAVVVLSCHRKGISQ